jgi:hypothetical protein
MAAGVRGNGFASIKAMKANLRALPVSLAHEVTQKAAPAITDLTRNAFAAKQSVYGEARPSSKVDGHPLALYRTGAVQGALRFVASGTILRCVLGPKYARFLIGKYGILPNGALPSSWSRKLSEITHTTKVAL